MPEPMFNDILERHLTRPFKMYVDTLRNKVSDLASKLNAPAALDQYPGRRVPYAFSRLYGPIPPTTARRNDPAVGFEGFAPLAQPSEFILPRNGSIKVGQIGSFFWQETNVYAYLSWTYSADPGTAVVATFPSAGDIFDNVVEENGGAVAFNNFRYFSSFNALRGRNYINFDLGLYEKTRGRFLHDQDRMPVNVFAGQNFANRKVAQPIRFDPNTELEPRIYVNELRLASALDTDQAFNAAQVKAYIFITFHGCLEQP